MDRWFSDNFMSPTFEASLADTAPALNVRETPDAYIVEVELPGINPGDVEVTVEGRALTIRGTYDQSEERQGTYLLREWRSGTFLRSVALPTVIDADHASSQVRNGELLLTLPKAAQHRARRLSIAANETDGGPERVIDDGNGSSPKRVSDTQEVADSRR
jgi:HSP20 family protein